MVGNETETRIQLKGGRSIKIIRTATPTGSVWSIPEMPEIAPHANLRVIRDRLRGKGLIASRPGEKVKMAVEDRFYFGKERFEKKVRRYVVKAWLDGKPGPLLYANNLAEARAIAPKFLKDALIRGNADTTEIRITAQYEDGSVEDLNSETLRKSYR